MKFVIEFTAFILLLIVVGYLSLIVMDRLNEQRREPDGNRL